VNEKTLVKVIEDKTFEPRFGGINLIQMIFISLEWKRVNILVDILKM